VDSLTGVQRFLTTTNGSIRVIQFQIFTRRINVANIGCGQVWDSSAT